MADSNGSDDTARGRNEGGVLANLPRTRPQRSSARRAAARGTTGAPARARKPAHSKRSTTSHADAAAAKTPSGAVRDSSASASAKAARATPKHRSAAAKRKAAPRRPGARGSRPPAPEEAAPRQGFECDGETTGGSVAPPGGAELVATAAEIVGELAKAGFSTGERLLKDVLSRLALS